MSVSLGIRLKGIEKYQGEKAPVTRGRLEVYILGKWGSVCYDGFNSNCAKVACRQLGLP